MHSHVTEAITPWLADHYRFVSSAEVTLLRAYTNDVFDVTSNGSRFALKIYGAGWRNASEIAYEMDLLAHLSSKDVRVARPIAGTNQRAIQRFPTPFGDRFAVLFAFAPGAKPTPPFEPPLYYQVGRSAAVLHNAADDFTSSHARTALDTTLLLDHPVELLQPLIGDSTDRDFILRFAERLRRTIHSLAKRGLDWGPCHGDLTLDNLHVTGDDRVIWYDFDSGGPGWRAADLPGWAALMPAAAPLADAFLSGYQSVRSIDRVNIVAAPFLYAAFEVWGIEIDLQNRVLRRGERAVQDYLSAAIDKLRPWATHFDSQGWEKTASVRG
jgi:Ser/Thr protein kinase RdoA (MazF antagonist)